MAQHKFILQFETGAHNTYIFDNAKAAMDAFDTFAAKFAEGLNGPFNYADTMHWLDVHGNGRAWAWVPKGFYWSIEHGTAWEQTTPDQLFSNVSVQLVEHNPAQLESN